MTHSNNGTIYSTPSIHNDTGTVHSSDFHYFSGVSPPSYGTKPSSTLPSTSFFTSTSHHKYRYTHKYRLLLHCIVPVQPYQYRVYRYRLFLRFLDLFIFSTYKYLYRYLPSKSNGPVPLTLLRVLRLVQVDFFPFLQVLSSSCTCTGTTSSTVRTCLLAIVLPVANFAIRYNTVQYYR